MLIKTSELTSSALDWAVAKCLGYVHTDGNVYLNYWAPSTEWSHAGPIIERERITVNIGWTTEQPLASIWTVKNKEGFAAFKQRGSTPLIAAMRCYVKSKLGDSVEVPDEFL